MFEPVIVDALVAPGHDGEAVLVVRVEHENGVVDSVTLDERAAAKLLADCRAEAPDELRGQPWSRLLAVLEGPARETRPVKDGGRELRPRGPRAAPAAGDR